jgi:RHS repeat-associated protein
VTTYNLTTVNLVNNLAYNPFGPAKDLGIGSGGTVNNTTNQSGNLEVINPGEQMEQIYTYDGNRNLLSVRGTNTPWYNQDFDYDALNRLLSADGIFGTIDFTYDNVGNRLTRTVDSQVDTYNYQPGASRISQITGANPAAFSHDTNGNITDIDSRTYVYNQNDRLVRVEEGIDILGEYTYNGLGQRQIKEVDGVTTVFHYDFDGNIIAESQADGTMTAEYLRVDQSRMAMVDVASGALYYFHNNYLGTPVLMTDSTGTVVWEGDYKPFGDAGVHPNSTVVNNFRFAGQYLDEETGLHYNYHRYYDPRTGRYLTPDPIGLVGGINLYQYASANPINSIDPLGLWGVGNAYGGAVTGFGLRFSLHFEFRVIHDSAKSFFDPKAWSGGFAATYSWANMWNNKCDDGDEDWALYGELDLGPDLLITNADHISQLLGYGKSVIGASGGYGRIGGDFELSVATNKFGDTLTNSQGQPIGELSVSIPQPWLPAGNYGFEVHGNTKSRTISHPAFIFGE